MGRINRTIRTILPML